MPGELPGASQRLSFGDVQLNRQAGASELVDDRGK
jgi:hypothetical protein